jgi:hypothetical protein
MADVMGQEHPGRLGGVRHGVEEPVVSAVMGVLQLHGGGGCEPVAAPAS